jgi:hypothetical protein
MSLGCRWRRAGETGVPEGTVKSRLARAPGGPGRLDSFQGTTCSDFGGDFLDADRVRVCGGNDSARVNRGDGRTNGTRL